MAHPPNAGSLLDHPRIGRSYFFPRPTPVPSPLWVAAGDARLACAFHRADEALAELVALAGGSPRVEP